METWKSIPTFEGHYEASTLGRVRSIDREQVYPKNGIRRLTGRVLAPFSNGRYFQVAICVDLKRSLQYVARLVALAFVPNPDGKPYVNHINGQRFDNRPENLEWCTQAENVQHSVDSGLWKPHHHRRPYRKRCPRCRKFPAREGAHLCK